MSRGGAAHRLSAVFTSGARRRGKLMVVHYLERPSHPTHVGVAVSKKLGGAVARNKIKRRIQHVVQGRVVADGYDIVINVRPAIREANFQQMEEELTKLLAESGLSA